MNISTPLPIKLPKLSDLSLSEQNELRKAEDEINRNFKSMYDMIKSISKEIENG